MRRLCRLLVVALGRVSAVPVLLTACYDLVGTCTLFFGLRLQNIRCPAPWGTPVVCSSPRTSRSRDPPASFNSIQTITGHYWALTLSVSHHVLFVVLFTMFLGSFCCVRLRVQVLADRVFVSGRGHFYFSVSDFGGTSGYFFLTPMCC